MTEYATEQLPAFDVGVGNFATKNARFRAFVCKHYNLKHVSVGGDGNCFFESFSLLLQPQCTPADLRKNCVDLFRQCLDSTQQLFETIAIEMEDELGREIVCSRRRLKINGLKPSSVAEYIDAVSNDGVWVQGLHWLRAVSFLYDVRVGIVIYGHEIVRFVGSGERAVFLYMSDGYTHFDPLVLSTGSPDRAPLIVEGPIVVESSSDQESTAAADTSALPRLRQRKATVKFSESESGTEIKSDSSGTYSYSYSLFCG